MRGNSGPILDAMLAPAEIVHEEKWSRQGHADQDKRPDDGIALGLRPWSPMRIHDPVITFDGDHKYESDVQSEASHE